MRRKIIVLTGAGISAESGIRTFRDSGGLWEEHDIAEVATFDAWRKNPDLVIRFYNERRKQVIEAEPNEGHTALVRLESKFDVHIITQNVDDLHERAGSKKILHLHGEIRKVRSTYDPKLVYTLDGWELKKGDRCEQGSQLRPHIVWFGEEVPEMANAQDIASSADIFIIVGTSLNVYPAAGLVHYAPPGCPVFLIDPNDVGTTGIKNTIVIREPASKGVPILVEKLLNAYTSE